MLDKIKVGLFELTHRGPDFNDFKIFRSVSSFKTVKEDLILGHTRLSIIDTQERSSQPMVTKDGRFSLIFNGAIVNYVEIRDKLKILGSKFITKSDTEVLLEAWAEWGVGCLKYITGMFAFTIYDKLNRKLFIVRDPFGIKPLYYCNDKEFFYFASEVPVLKKLRGNDQVSKQAIYDYLVWGRYDQGEATFFENIKSLKPGHILEIDFSKPFTNSDRFTYYKWWKPSIEEKFTGSFKDAAEKLRYLFLDSVKLHMRSDVPVGAALSGGLDSSSIVCAMRHLEPDFPLHTFSYIAKDKSINEVEWVDIINKYVGAIPHKVFCDHAELSKDYVNLIKTQGEPFGSASIYAQYRVFKEAREAGVVVMLDGQGGDEMLAGYDGFPSYRLRSLLDLSEYRDILRFIYFWPKLGGRGYYRAFLMLGWAITPNSFETLFRRILGQNPSPDWISKDWIKKNNIRFGYNYQSPTTEKGKGRRLIEKLSEEISGQGLLKLLRHADRNSMCWSVESRVPFLTRELVNFTFSLPENYLLSTDGKTKYIFREAMRDIVPKKILERHDKIGFSVPSNLENFKNLEDYSKNINIDYFNKNLFHKLSDKEAWRVQNFQSWLNQFYI